MKNEELMIGDWVFNTHNRKPEQVQEIGSALVMLDYNDLYEYDEIEPIPLTVWRAYDAEPDPGISWTLDEQWCLGYARAKGRRVKQMQVSRDQVFAYVSRRGEEEVIVL
jgi:hypothetical protein